MITANLVPVTSLLDVPLAQLTVYGVKTEGYVDLLRLQAGSPERFLVPEAWAIPARLHGSFDSSDLRRAFEALTAGLSKPHVLMARSSAIDEKPGVNPTLSVAFDPSDVEKSFHRFSAAVDEVLSVSDQMGALLCRMVGESTQLEDGTYAFGFTNVSFVADSHSPIHPREMHLAVVHGLGTRAVEVGSEFISISLLRDTGMITDFGNQSEAVIRARVGSLQPVQSPDKYRQKEADFFDLREGITKSRRLSARLFERDANLLMLDGGKLVDWDSYDGSSEIDESGRQTQRVLGLTPFGKLAMYHQLIGALKYLSSQMGPVQIEGAFPNHISNDLHLYQLLRVPELGKGSELVSLEQPFFTADRVVGRINFKGPLVWIQQRSFKGYYTPLRFDVAETLEFLDKKFAKSGYILLAPYHNLDVIAKSPHCRCRLSIGLENASSHIATATRMRVVEDPHGGYFLAMGVVNCMEGRKFPFATDYDDVTVVWGKDAHIVSNGEKMELEVAGWDTRLKRWAKKLLHR